MGLKDKAAKIDYASLPAATPPSLPTGLPVSVQNFVASRPKTAPGALMAATAERRAGLERENEALRGELRSLEGVAEQAQALRDELKAWDGAKATRLMDPRLISRSRWANRDPRHFETSEFEVLKAEILNAGGNIQPIKVRPVPDSGEGRPCYELIFGHRRHEACLQLGLPVLALVENLDDRALFCEMDRENRTRADLSAWEQGVMYRRALEAGLFPSNRKLADALGVDISNLSKALWLAALPDEVIAAFNSPMEVQYRWAKPLKDACEADLAGVVARAVTIAQLAPRPRGVEIFKLLMNKRGPADGHPSTLTVVLDGMDVAMVDLDVKGRASIRIKAGLVDSSQMAALAGVVKQFLAAK